MRIEAPWAGRFTRLAATVASARPVGTPFASLTSGTRLYTTVPVMIAVVALLPPFPWQARASASRTMAPKVWREARYSGMTTSKRRKDPVYHGLPGRSRVGIRRCALFLCGGCWGSSAEGTGPEEGVLGSHFHRN